MINVENNENFDRMGKLIGEVRHHEGISLYQLSRGLCTVAYLNQIENGRRESGKQLTDALLQRLGKSVDLFGIILDGKEFEQWQLRQKIVGCLARGNVNEARDLVKIYGKETKGSLAEQFVQTVEINIRASEGVPPKELLPFVQNALELTCPDFSSTPLKNILISQAEGRLLLAWLELREQVEGETAVAQAYMDLFHGLHASRYDSRSRIYLFPYIACHVIHWFYHRHQLYQALAVCDEALHELAVEKRLNASDKLLKWKQILFDEMGICNDFPGQQLRQLQSIQSVNKKQDPFISLEERGHVFCFNQLIRERRKLLNLSQEELSEGICDPRTVLRIETKNISPQKEIRKNILKKLRMSGERYDYQVISEHYEDYVLRSEYARACRDGKYACATELLSKLISNISGTVTNQQYIMTEEAYLRGRLPVSDPEHLSSEEEFHIREKALKLTIPNDLEDINHWHACALSINESILLINLAQDYQCFKNQKKSLEIYEYIRKCMKAYEGTLFYIDDFYLYAMFELSRILGNLGKYEESEALTKICVQYSMTSQNSRFLWLCCYSLAWLLEQRVLHSKMDIRKKYIKKISKLLQQAYYIAEIAEDRDGAQYICMHYQHFFGHKLLGQKLI